MLGQHDIVVFNHEMTYVTSRSLFHVDILFYHANPLNTSVDHTFSLADQLKVIGLRLKYMCKEKHLKTLAPGTKIAIEG